MPVAHLSIFVNGCLDDTSEWHDTLADAERSLRESYQWDKQPAVFIPGSDTDTVRAYRLWEEHENTGEYFPSIRMAEITVYESLEWCTCAGDRLELDNETGLYDPGQSVECMACERDQWDAENAAFDAWEVKNA